MRHQQLLVHATRCGLVVPGHPEEQKGQIGGGVDQYILGEGLKNERHKASSGCLIPS